MVSRCSRVKAQYTYDNLGCLSAVVDEAGNTALYTTMPSGTSSRLIAPSNTVTFNGTTATVVSSTAYAIICGDSTIASAGVDGGILTVRFTFRNGVIGFLEPVTGGKAGEFMREKIKYTDEPLGDLKVVRDFLPGPEELVFRDEGVKSPSRRAREALISLRVRP